MLPCDFVLPFSPGSYVELCRFLTDPLCDFFIQRITSNRCLIFWDLISTLIKYKALSVCEQHHHFRFYHLLSPQVMIIQTPVTTEPLAVFCKSHDNSTNTNFFILYPAFNASSHVSLGSNFANNSIVSFSLAATVFVSNPTVGMWTPYAYCAFTVDRPVRTSAPYRQSRTLSGHAPARLPC